MRRAAPGSTHSPSVGLLTAPRPTPPLPPRDPSAPPPPRASRPGRAGKAVVERLRGVSLGGESSCRAGRRRDPGRVLTEQRLQGPLVARRRGRGLRPGLDGGGLSLRRWGLLLTGDRAAHPADRAAAHFAGFPAPFATAPQSGVDPAPGVRAATGNPARA